MAEIVAGYIPVINDGYLKFFERHKEADIAVFDSSILDEFNYLRKDIRALPPPTVEKLLNGVGRNAYTIGKSALMQLMYNPDVFMPDDDISRKILSDYPESLIQVEPVFLRWDRDSSVVNQEVVADRVVNMKTNDPIIMALQSEVEKSSNWWRHVGAVMADNDVIIALSHNSSLPTSYSSAIDGDPRIVAHRGESIDLSIDIHAEARLIAGLAKKGISTSGKTLYVSTFPCPSCAKLIAESGIEKCYFSEGYATLDGQQILKIAGIELVQVITPDQPSVASSLKPYPLS